MLPSMTYLHGLYGFSKSIIGSIPANRLVHSDLGFQVFDQQAILLRGKLVAARGSHPGRAARAYRWPVDADEMRRRVDSLLLGTALFDPFVGYEARSFAFHVVSYAHIRALLCNHDFAFAVLDVGVMIWQRGRRATWTILTNVEREGHSREMKMVIGVPSAWTNTAGSVLPDIPVYVNRSPVNQPLTDSQALASYGQMSRDEMQRWEATGDSCETLPVADAGCTGDGGCS